MINIRELVNDLEKLVCEFCDEDTSNCINCCVEDEIIKVLEKNNIEVK